ncbi:MAG: acyl-CoA dehydrogenase family protein, partial [Dehalococcoidia bacterium]
MEWKDTPEQAAFRADVQAMIHTRLPERYRRLSATGDLEGRQWEWDRKSPDPAIRRAALDWHQALSERGWVAPHWPREYGGAGLTSMEQFILNQEVARAGAPHVGGSGVSLLGPTLIVHGTDEQRHRYLPPILAGEVTWAQGYS